MIETMIALVALAASAAEPVYPWMTFTKAPAFDQHVTVIDVGTLRATSHWAYWFRRTVRAPGRSQVWWTDTERCPAASSVLAKAVDLPAPKLDVPGLKSDDIVIEGDGVSYTFRGPAHYSDGMMTEIRFSSNLGTPLASWVDAGLRTLEPCWTKEPPSKG